MPVDFFRVFPLAGALLLGGLAACGSAPGARGVPAGANFAANILPDGTKLFTFSTRLPHPIEEAVRGASAFRDGDPDQAERRRRMPANLADTNRRALQEMLQENGYCREGYLLHELFEDRTEYVIRGECRDAASDADRARYSHQ